MTALLTQSAVVPVSPAHHAKVSRTELTPLSFLRRSAAVFPDKTAVVHGNRGDSYDYRTFAERVDRLASALRAAGLRKHDRVAFLCPNIPAMVEAHFAVPAAGGILVTINTRLNAAGGWLHPAPLRRPLPLRRRNPSSLDSAARSVRHHRRPDRRYRRRWRSLRGLPRERLPGARPNVAGRRGRDDLDQLHLGHDRPAEGRACGPTAAPTSTPWATSSRPG